MAELLTAKWQQLAEARAGKSWADFSDDSRSIDDSRSMGDNTNGASMGSLDGEVHLAYRPAWGIERHAAHQRGAAPSLTVSEPIDESEDGFISPTGRSSRRTRARGTAASAGPQRHNNDEEQLFDLLAADSRNGFNAAFKAGFSLTGGESNDAAALVDETSNGEKKRGRGGSHLPGLTTESQRVSKMPRLARGTDIAQQSKSHPNSGTLVAEEAQPAIEESSVAPRSTPRRRGGRVLTAASWASVATPDTVVAPEEVHISGSPASEPRPVMKIWGEPQATLPLSWAAVVEPVTQQANAQPPVEVPSTQTDSILDEPSDSEEVIEQRGRTETRESNEHRLAQRQRQIDIGKNSEEYVRYNDLFPKGGKAKRRARTPDKHQICSKRSFDGQISKWRRQLHAEVGDSSDSGVKTRAQRASKGKVLKLKPRVDAFFG